MADTYAILGQKLVEKGWPAPIPLRVSAKIPAISRWQRFNTETVSIEQAAKWSASLGAGGIGHAAGHNLLFVDVDQSDPASAATGAEICNTYLGPTPLVRIGRAPKFLRIYGLATSARASVVSGALSSTKHGGLELFITTGQVVFFGDHPDTGLPYTWPDASPLDLSPAALPLVTLPQLEGFKRAFINTLCKHGEDCPGENAEMGATREGAGYASALMRRINGDCLDPINAAIASIKAAPEGARHHTMVGAVVALVNFGYGDNDIAAALLDAYSARFDEEREKQKRASGLIDAIAWGRGKVGDDIDTIDAAVNSASWSLFT